MNTPVNFEIAVLLKQKEFKLPTIYYYDSVGDKCSGNSKTNWNKSQELLLLCSAPTIADVVMWLYETHEIWITVTSISQESWQCHMTKKGDSLGKCYFEDFYNPTEAYEAAIEHCLTKLI